MMFGSTHCNWCDKEWHLCECGKKPEVPEGYYKLDISDLRNLLRSRSPKGYAECEEASKNGWGELGGFPNEKWWWNEKLLQTLSEKRLWEIYQHLK